VDPSCSVAENAEYDLQVMAIYGVMQQSFIVCCPHSAQQFQHQRVNKTLDEVYLD
jgi:hypothetical protein